MGSSRDEMAASNAGGSFCCGSMFTAYAASNRGFVVDLPPRSAGLSVGFPRRSIAAYYR